MWFQPTIFSVIGFCYLGREAGEAKREDFPIMKNLLLIRWVPIYQNRKGFS